MTDATTGSSGHDATVRMAAQVVALGPVSARELRRRLLRVAFQAQRGGTHDLNPLVRHAAGYLVGGETRDAWEYAYASLQQAAHDDRDPTWTSLARSILAATWGDEARARAWLDAAVAET